MCIRDSLNGGATFTDCPAGTYTDLVTGKTYTGSTLSLIHILLLNCGIVIQHGQILGIVPKTYLQNYSEFYEKRWFASAQDLRDCEVRYAGHKVKLTPDVPKASLIALLM